MRTLFPAKIVTPNSKKGKLISISASETFSGPLPHPRILKSYEEILPGSANRILKMAETQSGHRMSLEKMIVSSGVKRERLGMDYALAILIIFIIAGTALILLGKETTGFIALFGPAVVQLVNYFLVKKDEKKEIAKNEKEQIPPQTPLKKQTKSKKIK